MAAKKKVAVAQKPAKTRAAAARPVKKKAVAAKPAKRPSAKTAGLSVGDKAPAFVSQTMKGDPFDGAQLAGKPRVLVYTVSFGFDAARERYYALRDFIDAVSATKTRVAVISPLPSSELDMHVMGKALKLSDQLISYLGPDERFLQRYGTAKAGTSAIFVVDGSDRITYAHYFKLGVPLSFDDALAAVKALPR